MVAARCWRRQTVESMAVLSARNIYWAISPCVYPDECPHDRDIKTCETVVNSKAHECPTSVSLHAVHRGLITASLESGTPDNVISNRANVSQEVCAAAPDVDVNE